MRLAAGIGRDDIVLLSVGRLEENKGFHHLAAALGALAAHGGRLPEGRWRWIVIGEGPFRGRLEDAIREANLGSAAMLVGRAEDKDLHAWYEAATLFVHPTLYEGSSLVTLEAMAHRRAVVATNAGGLPDKVKPGVNGWLVEPGRSVGACRRDQRRDRRTRKRSPRSARLDGGSSKRSSRGTRRDGRPWRSTKSFWRSSSAQGRRLTGSGRSGKTYDRLLGDPASSLEP